MIPIAEQRDLTLNKLLALRDREARYRYVIASGKNAPALPEELRVDANAVDGCVAKTWLITVEKGGRYAFRMDSEAVIIRGILAILLSVYDNRSPAEIATVSPCFLSEAGILDTLSANRRNGLAAICRRIVAVGEPPCGV